MLKGLGIILCFMCSTTVFAVGPNQIHCSGWDLYGDVKWSTNIYMSSNQIRIRYIEETGGAKPATSWTSGTVQQGRLALPSPDGAVRIYLNLLQPHFAPEFYASSNGQRVQNPFSSFACQ